MIIDRDFFMYFNLSVLYILMGSPLLIVVCFAIDCPKILAIYNIIVRFCCCHMAFI